MPPLPGSQSLKWLGLAHLRRLGAHGGEHSVSGLRFGLSAMVGPLADFLVFLALSAGGARVASAHIASFAAGAVLNYLVHVRRAVLAAGRQHDWRLHGHLLAIGLFALFLRGGVLSLLMYRWNWPPQAAIVVAVAATVAVMRPCHAFALSSGVWSLASGAGWRVLAIGVAASALLLRLIYLPQVQLLPEETYYWNYAQHLDIGYLDHPPMVAWLIRLGTAVFGNTELGVRIGALGSAAIASVFAYRLTRNLFGEPSALVAVVLMQVLPFFFLAGVIMTPDAPLTAAWAGALYFLERALLGGRAGAWWLAGVCIGLGLLSKYTIGLLVAASFVFVLADAQARRWLGRWPPYGALALALALFAPVIVWNAQHHWASFAFQTVRRLTDTPQFALHKLIASALVLLTPAGFVTLAAVLFRRRAVEGEGGSTADARRRWRFVQATVLVPLAVFVIFSLRHEVKLDWTGALWVAAVPALAFCIVSLAQRAEDGCGTLRHSAWVPTVVVLLLLYGAGLHYLVLGLPGLGYSRHTELVPVVWRELGRQIDATVGEVRGRTGQEPLVVGMDRYVIASELAFYAREQRSAVRDTASRHLFGLDALMYELWFPAGAEQGRTALLVGWNPQDIAGNDIAAHVERLEAVREGSLERDGRLVRHYYYRVAYGLR